MIPTNLVLFRFPGFGPQLSQALAALTLDRRVVLAEAATNPGTSLAHGIDLAVPAALQGLGMGHTDTRVYLWTPSDPLKPNSLWRVDVGQEMPWREEQGWKDDPNLAGAVDALKRASTSW